jgi:hypothetical protein
MQPRRLEGFDRSHSAKPRYQPQAHYDPSKKIPRKQARKFGRHRYSKFFVSFVSFLVNFTRLAMSDDRKTLEQRAAITAIERVRHSASHVLAFCHVERSRDISYHFP